MTDHDFWNIVRETPSIEFAFALLVAFTAIFLGMRLFESRHHKSRAQATGKAPQAKAAEARPISGE